jgi:hypothetical protein
MDFSHVDSFTLLSDLVGCQMIIVRLWFLVMVTLLVEHHLNTGWIAHGSAAVGTFDCLYSMLRRI